MGANLTHVSDIMHTGDRIPKVPLGTKMPEAVMELSNKRFGCVCVTDGDRLAGIITDGDLARNLRRDMADLLVQGHARPGQLRRQAEDLGIAAIA